MKEESSTTRNTMFNVVVGTVEKQDWDNCAGLYPSTNKLITKFVKEEERVELRKVHFCAIRVDRVDSGFSEPGRGGSAWNCDA